MAESVIGLQQIITTIAFLAVMIGVLIFLRAKGGGLRRSLHNNKRIEVVEETGISPTEKMRLIRIDQKEFIVISAKGVQPVISLLGEAAEQPASPASAQHAAQTQPQTQAQASTAQSPMVLTEENTVSSSAFQRALEKAATSSDSTDELSAFSQKFKSWRMS